MDDEQLLRYLIDYLDSISDPNEEMLGVRIVWERDAEGFGTKHIWDLHAVTEQEVEEVLLQIPPYVEAKRHPDFPDRTIFWGATRFDRRLFVVCEDWMGEDGTRFLRPITAFEPDEGVGYWERFR